MPEEPLKDSVAVVFITDLLVFQPKSFQNVYSFTEIVRLQQKNKTDRQWDRGMQSTTTTTKKSQHLKMSVSQRDFIHLSSFFGRTSIERTSADERNKGLPNNRFISIRFTKCFYTAIYYINCALCLVSAVHKSLVRF